jgi:hypothetical protein
MVAFRAARKISVSVTSDTRRTASKQPGIQDVTLRTNPE